MGESITERINRLTAQRQQPPRSAVSPAPATQELPDKDELRRARTHRLVQIGALTDQYFGTGELSPEEVGKVLAVIMDNQEIRDIVQKAVE